MNFSTEEMVDMVYVLGASDNNCLLATRLYLERYPDRRQPSRKSFQKLMNRFNRTGSVNYTKTERRKTVLTEENQLNTLLAIEENPTVSTRALADQLDITRSSLRAILKLHKFHPFHVQLHQELNEQDFLNRVTFCTWAQQRIQRERNFFDFVLFVDESTFHKNGFVNKHNFHYYSRENPRMVITHSQNRWSLNVLGGIIGNYVVGPHFFEGTVTSEVYLQFLRNDLNQLMNHIPADIRQRMWLLHDGCPAHYAARVREYLDQEFPNRWIGRGGPVPWPSRSPDLTKIDFFLWGFIKDNVYQIPPTTREDMQNRIREAFRRIDVNTLRRVERSFQERLQSCLNAGGQHFEQF